MGKVATIVASTAPSFIEATACLHSLRLGPHKHRRGSYDLLGLTQNLEVRLGRYVELEEPWPVQPRLEGVCNRAFPVEIALLMRYIMSKSKRGFGREHRTGH